MKKFDKNSIVIVVVASFVFGLIGPISALAATTPSLGMAATFGVLGSTYTNTAATTVNGDLGYVTGPGVVPAVNGTTYVNAGIYGPSRSRSGNRFGCFKCRGV